MSKPTINLIAIDGTLWPVHTTDYQLEIYKYTNTPIHCKALLELTRQEDKFQTIKQK